jgi:TonB family protein
MRKRLPVVIVGLLLAVASTCFAQQSSAASTAGDFVPLALPPALARAPDDKSHNPILDRAWTNRTIDVEGLRAVVGFPSEWLVLEQQPPMELLLMSPNRRASVAVISSARLAPMSLNAPMPARILTQVSSVIAAGGVIVNRAGQVKLGSRYWLWMDALAPSNIRRPPGFSAELAFEPFHVWGFITTEAGRMVQIALTVGAPRGSTAAETEAEVHSAADVFLEMLTRVTLEARASQPSPPRTDTGPPPEGVARIGQRGVTIPKLLTQVQPSYTVDAMRARISGIVVLECVVEVDGSVGFVRVLRSLDAINGLDDEAVKAAKQWRFTPGMKDGVPVPVLVSIEMSFTLRPPPSPPEPH